MAFADNPDLQADPAGGTEAIVAQPPPYSRPSTVDSRTDASSPNDLRPPPPIPPPLPPAIQPCNHLAISRSNEHMKSAYIVDPYLRIPPTLLPPLSPEEEAEGLGEAARRNLRFEMQNNWLDAEVWVVDGRKGWRREQDGAGLTEAFGVGDVKRDSNSEAEKKLVRVDVKLTNTHATIKLRSEDDLPVRLSVTANNSNLSLYIPRSFTGPLKLVTKQGSLSLSEPLSALLTTFSDVKDVRQCFVGDYSLLSRASSSDGLGLKEPWSGKEEDWDGDALILDSSNSRLKLYFVDEPKKENSGGSLFGKLFGWK